MQRDVRFVICSSRRKVRSTNGSASDRGRSLTFVQIALPYPNAVINKFKGLN